ncbi:hypothetical protein ACFQI3_01445 [Hansschlegelia quercus]|uniref:Uncharacterized protein n=1 Tax=Hansschlegelia quercus TaxID=2528245 RepID=A0A4Q9GN63_9HYPH|nr:hypothetical protein [Hansschlegelia quercus]TBN54615.1 hypothetical protein EYR15_00085 [Hansschlegelia quercus]
MKDLAPEEQFTLELVAAGGEHTVVDHVALQRLETIGLVELSNEGWDVTPLGACVVDRAA